MGWSLLIFTGGDLLWELYCSNLDLCVATFRCLDLEISRPKIWSCRRDRGVCGAQGQVVCEAQVALREYLRFQLKTQNICDSYKIVCQQGPGKYLTRSNDGFWFRKPHKPNENSITSIRLCSLLEIANQDYDPKELRPVSKRPTEQSDKKVWGGLKVEGTWGEGWGGILAKAEYGRGSLLGGVGGLRSDGMGGIGLCGEKGIGCPQWPQ